MRNLCNKNITIEYSNVDTNLHLNVFHATNIVQDIMTNLFDNIGITNMFLKNNYNAAWVISKLKISFMGHPKLNDSLNATAFVSNRSKLRLNLNALFCDFLGNTLFCAKQEICPMDLTTRKVKSLSSINYPIELNLKDSMYNISFSRFKLELSTFVKVYDYLVSYCDIDFTRHVNNASYIRFILNALNTDFFDKNIITDLEIHYINECHAGDLLSIYKKTTDDTISFVILHNETKIIESILKFKQHAM